MSNELLTPMEEDSVAAYYNDIIKSSEDKRQYRGLVLKNRLRILLISDPSSEKGAAALDVNVGYYSDPDNIPGLAHFLEHMLFLGTAKYPGINDFSKYISEHGGENNASTTSDHTVYYFDVVADFLENALDRFAQFFICPLFTEESTDKEVHAVNSEYEKNFPKDMWRLDQLDRHLSKKCHPYSKFGVGNLQTLHNIPKRSGLNVREELLNFHKKWYSSNIMTLAILGKENIDELEKMAISFFSGIVDKNIENKEWSEPPFGPEQLQLKGYVVPNKNTRNLSISFPIPDYNKFYKSKPFYYISHLIGHEGPGSLLSALKRRGWCHQLFASGRICAKGFGTFFVKCDLTEVGLDHIDDIVELCFQYIHMLEKVGPQKWFYEEHRDFLNTAYRYKEKERPLLYVTTAVKNMHIYPLNEILVAPILVDTWDPDLISRLLAGLNPENIRMAITGQKFEEITNNKEPWYGTKYRVEKITAELIQRWKNCGTNDELKFPEPNKFITSNFEIYPRDEIQPHPVIIHESLLSRVWHKQDNEFLMPRADAKFEIFNPIVYLDPLNCNLTHIYTEIVRDSLCESLYAAELAGLKWFIRFTEYGMMVGISGYNEKQGLLLDKILDKMMNLKIDPDRFNIVKDTYIRMLKNFDVEQPSEQANYYLATITSEFSWERGELLKATEDVTIKRLEEYIPLLFSKLHIECLFHGNVTKEKALEMVSLFEEKLKSSSMTVTPLLPPQLLRRREVQMVDGSAFLYTLTNKYHKSSCTHVYYQCGVLTTEKITMLELMVQIMLDPLVDNLRTHEQLGYTVYCNLRRNNSVLGLQVVVQSEKHPSYLEQRIEAFLIKFREMLENMDEKEFQTHKDTLAGIRLEKPKTLAALTMRYWNEIFLQLYDFNRVEEEVAFLRTIEKHQLLQFFDNFIKFEAPYRHKLSVHVLSEVPNGAGSKPPPTPEMLTSQPDGLSKPPPYVPPIVIEDVIQFKSSHPLYPLAQPRVKLSSMRTKSKL